MSTSITLNLPDQLYRRAQNLAQLINRDINDILIEAINLSFIQTEDLSRVDSLSDQEVIRLTQLEMEPNQDERLSQLLEQQQAGLLNDTERGELWSLMQIYQTLLLQKAQGLNEAVHRGLIQPLSS
ncbi:conserved hypothetical protein [Gloeothece citriformis PCC 7424]|uniref:Uncharacterized protein n=1 Tax=Gloeothece citriformis (strain PCC 7424) TaxID=65393 RepID=B7KJ31_GLOC7|nr:hypothetical protein [Gloeothece citriformis]ACK70867.1 conserved hypothetical protein [Gloeothece citriformis PCC 7424]ACK72287.1 conserved hypothetical protein [Gloeothece citriformis PCC 7424]